VLFVTALAFQGDYHADSNVSLHQIVQAIVTVLAVINPGVCGSIFLTLTPRLLPEQRWRAAVRVTLSILIILITSALIGLKILSVFNISLDVFKIVGGMIIAYMGFDMLRGGQTVAQAPPTEGNAAAWFSDDRGSRRSDWRSSYVGEFASCYQVRVAYWSRHTVRGHPLHGANCGIDGDGVCADGLEGVLQRLMASAKKEIAGRAIIVRYSG